MGVSCSIDLERFNPEVVTRNVSRPCVWGFHRDTKVILVTGRILRRKGHHVVVRAAQRLKEMGLRFFSAFFVGEDRGRTCYTGE